MSSSAKPDLICVDPERVCDFWAYARPLIKAAMDHTELSSFSDLESDVLSGDQLLWLVWSDRLEAAVTTRLIKTDWKPICIITACSGYQMDRWLPLIEKIENYARAEGARAVRIFGRKGWERVLDGYHAEHVILEKAI